jgi:outer membrane lipoprotein SlyB
MKVDIACVVLISATLSLGATVGGPVLLGARLAIVGADVAYALAAGAGAAVGRLAAAAIENNLNKENDSDDKAKK